MINFAECASTTGFVTNSINESFETFIRQSTYNDMVCVKIDVMDVMKKKDASEKSRL